MKTYRIVLVGIVLGLGALAAWTSEVQAATFYFDAAGGTPIWDSTVANWSTISIGSYDSTWTGGDACFQGTAGTVFVAGAVSANSILFSVDGYTLNSSGGGGTITLTGAGGSITTGGDLDTISTTLAGSVGLTKLGSGTLAVSGGNAYNGPTNVAAGTLQLIGAGAWNPVLNLDGANLQSGKLVFDYTGGTSPAATIQSILKTSYGAAFGTTHFAATNGGKIYSSTTAAAAGTALGWKDDAAAVTVMYTLYGDTNLDGTVNSIDLETLISHYNTTNDVWSSGDLNYDGSVNLTDLGILLDHFNTTLNVTPIIAPLDSAAIRLLGAHGISVVPEPGTLILLAAALAGLFVRAWQKRK